MKRIGKGTKEELLGILRERYGNTAKKEKTKILDEFVALSGYHRKHAIRLMTGKSKSLGTLSPACKKIYDEAVSEALTTIWEAADRICGKRLKEVLPVFLESLERSGHLELDPDVRKRLLRISAPTIDRLLASRKKRAKGKRKRKKPSKPSGKVPVRTFADWAEPDPGYFEIDFVEHGGGSMAGSYIHTLAATDIASGWFECIPLLAREQSLVVEGLKVLGHQCPVSILGIDSDNDGAFINDTLIDYCNEYGIEFTRSRAYRKNDQAWIEQKNGAVVRRFVGYKRYSGVIEGQIIAQLYQSVRLYVNYFQPSFKIREKIRTGSKVKKLYYKPATPCQRLLEHPKTSDSVKEELRSNQKQLDPIKLLHQIRDSQEALASMASLGDAPSRQGRESLDEFLTRLPQLWREGEARPTHRDEKAGKRAYRTRKDPFQGVWPDVLGWLQFEPDLTGKQLMTRLQETYPGQFPDSQLRTLQRRVKEWRNFMARKLVYAGADGDGISSEIFVVGSLDAMQRNNEEKDAISQP